MCAALYVDYDFTIRIAARQPFSSDATMQRRIIAMAELDRTTPHPTEIKLHQKSRMLEISFADGNTFRLPCEFLRVYSPSAEVRGHGPGQEVLQVGKKDVEITHIEPRQYVRRMEAARASREPACGPIEQRPKSK